MKEEYSADIDVALLWAINKGNGDKVSLLLKNNADPNVKLHSFTPLILAAEKGHLNIVNLLLEHNT